MTTLPSTFLLFPLLESLVIFPERKKLFPCFDRNRMVPDDIQPLIIVAISTGRLIHGPRGIDLVVDHRLFQMHEAVMLINLDRNPGFAQRRERCSLLRIVETFPIGEETNIYTTPFRLNQRFHRERRRDAIHGHKNVSFGTVIDPYEVFERPILRAIPDFDRCG